jgi:7-keto-8-aminopelargonate synthetase-like enzyme
VLGPQGRGTAAQFGLTDDVDMIMGTFSKSFASIGGFVAGDADIMEWVKHNARAFMFSAAISPAQVAAAIAALEIMQSEPERIEQLWRNTRKMHEGFRSMGFNIGPSQTPVIPIIIGDGSRRRLPGRCCLRPPTRTRSFARRPAQQEPAAHVVHGHAHRRASRTLCSRRSIRWARNLSYSVRR